MGPVVIVLPQVTPDAFPGFFRKRLVNPWGTRLGVVDRWSTERPKRAAMQPEGGYVDLNLTREGGEPYVFRVEIKLKSEIPVGAHAEREDRG